MDPKFLLAIALTLPLCAQVKITQQGKEKISVEIDGKPFTDFYIGSETAKPYLHPLRTADGKVSRDRQTVPASAAHGGW